MKRNVEWCRNKFKCLYCRAMSEAADRVYDGTCKKHIVNKYDPSYPLTKAVMKPTPDGGHIYSPPEYDDSEVPLNCPFKTEYQILLDEILK